MNSTKPYSPDFFLVFEWEKNFNGTATREWMRQNSIVVWYCATLYMSLIFGIQNFMKKRKAFHLKYVLFMWNLLLFTWSVITTFRSSNEMLYVLKTFGFAYSVCNYDGFFHEYVSGLWTWLYILGKFFELGDTLFIVLRKRKLIFLHWYHHMVTMIVVWYVYTEALAVGRWFLLMNSTIHLFMYLYYALVTINIKVPHLSVMSLTALQISQMALGCCLIYAAYNIKAVERECNFPENVALVVVVMYVTYFALFCKYFWDFYLRVVLTSTNKKRE